MFRLAGVVLLVFGSGGYSYCICREMEHRLEGLYEIKKMYQQFESYVNYSSSTFPELCKMTAENMEGSFRDFLYEVFKETEKNTGKPLPEIWRETIDLYFEEFPLKKKDKVYLLDFFAPFGSADRSMQLQSMENRLSLLEMEIIETQKHMAEKKKITMSLGIMGGLVAAILLL